METRERELKKQQEVLGGYDPQQYQSERIYATAPDGVEVPISLVYKKGFVRDGRAPMLLYGYGSYGISIDPSFSSDRLSLLDRGFVYAIAHIRGGMDLGKPWHEDGRLLKKKNTFTDFIACAEKLIAEKYTSPDRLAIMGGSAGGLLMGAVVEHAPGSVRRRGRRRAVRRLAEHRARRVAAAHRRRIRRIGRPQQARVLRLHEVLRAL